MNLWMRLRFVALVISDRLLGTQLVERELERLNRRIKSYEAQADAIQQQRENLSDLLLTAQVELCVLYLQQRYILQPQTWLRFAPAEDPEEERGLDMLIDRLVKQKFASVHVDEIDESSEGNEQTYVYHLRPDWAAIIEQLYSRKEHLDPETISWIERFLE
jgi:hypothetical protein